MTFIAFPLRLERGLLKRCDEPEAIVLLVRAMARTPHGSWIGSSHFGLRDFFEGARTRLSPVQTAIEELNLALWDLGITHYRVRAATRERSSQIGADSYFLTLVPVEGGPESSFKVEP